MKLTHNEEPKEFKPFSITITFESEQEAVNMLHYLNCTGTSALEEVINVKLNHKPYPPYKAAFSGCFTSFKELLQSKGIIK